MPTTDEIVDLYRRRARNYHLTANLYYLVGFREFQLRKRAVAALGLARGATVVEIGCGTGLNFEYLRAAVGPRGRIVGVENYRFTERFGGMAYLAEGQRIRNLG